MTTEPPASTTSQSATPPARRLLTNLLPRVLASLLIAGGFIWLMSRGGLPMLPPRAELARLPLWSLAAYFGIQVVSTVLRTYRWVHLLRPIAPQISAVRVMGIGSVGIGAVFLAPLRSGEIVRPYLAARDGDVSFMQAAGTVGAERVIDGLVLTLFTFVALTLAAPVSPLPTSLGDLPLPVAALPGIVYTALLVFAGAFAAMTAFYVAREQARRVTSRLVGLVSERGARWASSVLERVADGLSFLPSRKPLFAFFRDTIGYWLLGILAQWLLLHEAGLPASLAQTCTTVGILNLGALVPAGPGMFGAYQIAGFSALALFFPLAQVRLAGGVVIFITYATQLLLNSAQLGLGLWLLARFPRTRPATSG